MGGGRPWVGGWGGGRCPLTGVTSIPRESTYKMVGGAGGWAGHFFLKNKHFGANFSLNLNVI